MKTPQQSTSAFDIFKNYLPAIVLIGTGLASLMSFWFDTRAVAKKVETNKAETDAIIKAIDDKVTRQYGIQREMNEKTNKEVDDLKQWKAWTEGYKQAEKDLKK